MRVYSQQMVSWCISSPQCFFPGSALEKVTPVFKFAQMPDRADKNEIEFSLHEITRLAHNDNIIFNNLCRHRAEFNSSRWNYDGAQINDVALPEVFFTTYGLIPWIFTHASSPSLWLIRLYDSGRCLSDLFYLDI